MMWSTPSGRYWDSWGDMGRLQREVDRLLGRYADSPTAAAGEFPAVNVWAGDDRVVLTAEVPGVDPKAIELTVVNRSSRAAQPLPSSSTSTAPRPDWSRAWRRFSTK